MISHSQRDPLWAEKPIPGTNMTIGRVGCVITSIADLAAYFGESLTPADVAQKCRFTSGGLIWWNSCIFNNFVWERREYGRNDANIRAALDDRNRGVIVQVANQSHWAMGVGYDENSKQLIIADPWLGDFTTMARYGNSITGAAYFRRK